MKWNTPQRHCAQACRVLPESALVPSPPPCRIASPTAELLRSALATATMEERKGEAKMEEEAEEPEALPPPPALSAPQLQALLPARAARPLDPPEFQWGNLRRLALAAHPGERRVTYDVLTSGCVCVSVCACVDLICCWDWFDLVQ